MDYAESTKWSCVMRRALLLAAAIGILSTAANGQSEGGQPDWIEQAKIVAQMQGITVGEAVRRKRLQDKVADWDRRFDSDPAYGGAWIEQKGPTFRATFGFKGGKGARSIDDAELSAVSDFASVRTSMRELQQERERLSQILRQHNLTAAIVVDRREQRLSIFPDDPARLKSLIDVGTLTIAPFVDIKAGPAIRTDHANIEGAGLMTGSALNAQGVMESYRCVGGFVVSDGTRRGLATAGHCDHKPGDLKTHRGLPVGTRMGYVYHQNGLDVSWHHKSTDTYLPRVRTSATSYYSITSVGPQLPPIGTTICIILKDDRQVCAYVGPNVAWWGSDGPYPVMDRTVAALGDSGGPWLYGGKAYGIHSGNMQWEVGGPKYDHYTPAASLPGMGISVVVQ